MTRELITFEVSRQMFGIDVAVVREIRAWSPITGAPDVPHYVAGMADLNGSCLPVIDLGARLGWGSTRIGEKHAILSIRMGRLEAGLIVETVSDLITLKESALQSVPRLGMEDMTSFIDGLIPMGSRMLLVINVEQLLGYQELRAA